MRRSDFIKIALMAACLCTGCTPKITKVSVCETCEDKPTPISPPYEDKTPMVAKVKTPANFHPVILKPGELQSMQKAMPAKAATGGAKAVHLHAEVVNGELQFHADDDPTHVTKTQLSMAVETDDGSGPTSVRVVATPEAANLLHQRAGQVSMQSAG